MTSSRAKFAWLVAIWCLYFEMVSCDFASRPKFVAHDGHLYITCAEGKNITLKTDGHNSYINVDGENLVDIMRAARSASRMVRMMTSTTSVSNSQFGYLSLYNNLHGPSGLQRRLSALEGALIPHLNNTFGNNNTPVAPAALSNIQLLGIPRRMFLLERQVNRIRRLMNTNECNSNPCAHGGTCIDMFNGFICTCPPNWEGARCNIDVNECEAYSGTDLGCQNNAQCINKPGTYECTCLSGWFGIHCTRRKLDCSQGNAEMCSHGICVEQNSGHGISCICDQGWKSSGSDLSCSTDVDECTENPQCSPLSTCTNLPGTFFCSPCPQGYTGNGRHCVDIDECQDGNNGGCSKSPRVQCINTVGSSICGPCPPGYEGDGKSCTYRGACNINNGGCYPGAQCIENSALGASFVQCICPVGSTGHGIGMGGCTRQLAPDNQPTPSRNGRCTPTTCRHGICHNTPYGYACICNNNYIGRNCDILKTSCDTNPCQHGGTCRPDARNETNFRCDCTAEFTGRYCQIQTTTCGGLLNQEEGKIEYPAANLSSYSHNSRCAWIIETTSNKVLLVNFTRFNLESSPDCQYDWLQIHDGRSSGSQMIGRFCGTTLPKGGSFVSTLNSLYLWFRSDHTIAHSGFSLRWKSIDPVCGAFIEVTRNGQISSPGWPGKYPPNRDCYWTLTAAETNMRIQVHFFSLQIESHPNCSYDYLAVYNGITNTDPLVAKYCNTSLPAPLLIPGPGALIHFHSDAFKTDTGFQLSYALVEGVPGCGGVYTRKSGEITPPMEKGVYVRNIRCVYKIQMIRGYQIEINFLSFDLEHGCSFDYVKIFDGPTEQSKLIGTYCGSDIPPSFISSTNDVTIIFNSDFSVAGEGFMLKYSLVCSHTLSEDSGSFTSPGYPNEYPEDHRCVFTIATRPGTIIELSFIDFDLEGGYSNCEFDMLEIRDGDNIQSKLLGKYCGSSENMPPRTVSSSNYLTVVLIADESISGTGFSANYTTIDRGCGGTFKEMTGIISYPSSSQTNTTTTGEYNTNMICNWILSGPEGYSIQITWLAFDLEKIADTDYVELWENDTITGESQRMGKFYGTNMPPVLTSRTNMVTISFISDFSFGGTGFTLSYLFIDNTKICGGSFVTVKGMLRSPGYPNTYPARKDCTWIITAPIGQQIALNFTVFDLESATEKCIHDYLEIRNGGYKDAPLIGSYCGRKKPTVIPSSGNQLYLHFHTDVSISGGGFVVEWDATSTGCGGLLTGSSGEIISPNYPQPYGYNAECFWKIIVSQGSAININFSDLELEPNSVCYFDYIEIFDGIDSSAKSLGRFCSSEFLPTHLITKSNFAYIKFHSDMSISGKGFSVTYNSVCNNEITGFQGVIESPDFPSPYSNNVRCEWSVKVAKGNKIDVIFSHFALEGALSQTMVSLSTMLNLTYIPNKECQFDSIQLKDGSNTRAVKYCGSDLPPRFTTTDNHLIVTFVTDSYLTYSGFRLEWSVKGCGGKMTRPSDVLSSPDFPHFSNADCEWVIIVAEDSSIELTVNHMHSPSISCNTSYDLSIFNGPDNESVPLLEVCSHETPFTVTSNGNYMFVRYRPNENSRSSGLFRAVYRTLTAKCGGRFTAKHGIITSPNYPMNYIPNAHCYWYIEVSTSHLISFSFNDFDIARVGHLNYCRDTVKLFRGREPTKDNLIKTYCGSGIPENSTFTTDSNALTIELTASPNGGAKGFSANYSMACGARIVTSTEGIINHNALNGIINTDNCTWSIIADRPDQKMSLTITHLMFSPDGVYNGNCSLMYLNIFNGDTIHAPKIGTYCGVQVPPTIVSFGSALTIQTASSYKRNWGQFSAHYSVLDSACGGTLTSESGVIASPMYPNSYPMNADCIWKLQTSPGNKVSLSFEKFDVDYSANCDEDYLELREANAIGKLLGLYCGNGIPTSFTIANEIWMKFHSDSQGTAPGFVANYDFVHGNDIEGQSSGAIASPLYPRRYTKTGYFTWRITVNTTNRINMDITEYTSPGTNCETSHLAFFDGYDETSPLLCVQDYPDNSISTTSNMAFIEFQTDSSPYGSAFKFEWKEIAVDSLSADKDTENKTAAKCGTTAIQFIDQKMQYLLSSPNYPRDYEDNLACEWLFNTDPTSHLKIKFSVIEMEDSINCQLDKISVFTSGDSGHSWRKITQDLCLSNSTLDPPLHGTNYLKVRFETDYLIAKSGFLATVYAECGGIINQKSGEITVTPNRYRSRFIFGDHYRGIRRTQDRCEWLINARPGKTINLSFEQFNISVGNLNTCENYIMFRNGGSKDSPVLGKGKYCGSVPPDSLESFGNQVYIIFVTEISARTLLDMSKGNEFVLKYEEKSVDCGAFHKLNSLTENTIISSPNYPNIPIAHTECVWTIMGPLGERLKLDFIDRFDLSSDCTNEYVELRDGGTDLSPLLGTFCKDAPGTQITTGNILYVKFFTDVADPHNGFKANVTVDDCGGIIKGTNGVILSPGYPSFDRFKNNKTCKWHVIGSHDHSLWFNFIDFDLPVTRNPCSAQIQLYDYIKTDIQNTSVLGDPICSMARPAPIMSSGNEAIVEFKYTHDSVMASYLSATKPRGFKISFNSSQMVCGGHLNSVSGYLISPGYPKGVTSHKFCEWMIVVPNGRRVTVDIIDLDLGSSDGPILSSIGFYNDFGYKSLIRSVGSSDSPSKVESTGNKMLVYYRAWRSTTRRGFKARFSSDNPTLCEGNLDGDSGTIMSPSINYNLSTFYCEWRRSVQVDDKTNSMIDSAGQTLVITVSNAKIGLRGGNCRYASSNVVFLGYFLPVSSFSSRLTIRSLCGVYSSPAIISSPSPAIAIQATQSVLNKVEFKLEYKINPCGGLIKKLDDNFFVLPKNHTGSLDCAWMITAPEGKTIKITLTKSEFFNENCEKEFLKIYNGYTPTSPTLATICQSDKANTAVTSFTRYLWMEYHSENFSNKTNINVKMETVGSNCDAMSYSRTFNSPSFPKAYGANEECTWYLNADTSSAISLGFETRFHIEKSINCTKDFVEVFDYVNGTYSSMGRECGRELPTRFNSTGNKMKVIFRSDGTINGDGFKARWTPICRRTFVATENLQYLTSPGWPILYRRNLECEYKITGNGENQVVITTLDFDLETDTSICRFDNFTIQLLSNEYSDQNGRIYCGKNKPPLIRDKLGFTITFKTDQWLQKQGFRLSYQLENCGGSITTPQLLKSPVGESGTYYDDMKCQWNITAPSNNIVILKFQKLSMEASPGIYLDCSMDHVSVYEGFETELSHRLGQFCGNLTAKPPTLRSTGNTMAIQMVTDEYFVFEGFEVYISFMYDESTGCGGTKELGVGQSEEFSTPALQHGVRFYEPFLDCQWVIRAPSTYVLRVEFKSIHIAPCFNLMNAPNSANITESINCTCDYLELRNGPTYASEFIGRFCGHPSPLPPIITSSSRVLWARFVTDGTSTSTGYKFKVSVAKIVCGDQQLSLTNDRTIITSPDFDKGVVPRGLHCVWRLKSEDVFAIRILSLDLVPAETTTRSCVNDRLEIIDVPSNPLYVKSQGPELVVSGVSDNEAPMGSFVICSLPAPITVYPNDNEAAIKLITSLENSATTHKGFKLEILKMSCGYNYTELQGRIRIKSDKNCVTSISVPQNRTISISLLRFVPSLDNLVPTCANSRLEIKDGPSPSDRLLDTICSKNINPIFSTGSNLLLALTATNEVLYDLQYITTDQGRACGGNIQGNRGKVYSPFYPSTYRQIKTCEWTITTSADSAVTLTFDAFDLGSSVTCPKNNLQIVNRDGAVSRSYCGSDNPAPYTSEDNYVKLIYNTAMNNGGIGWHITFSSTKQYPWMENISN